METTKEVDKSKKRLIQKFHPTKTVPISQPWQDELKREYELNRNRYSSQASRKKYLPGFVDDDGSFYDQRYYGEVRL